MGLPHANPDRHNHTHSNGYRDCYTPAYRHTAAPAESDSCPNRHGCARADQHTYACANSHPHANPATNSRIRHTHSNYTLTVAARVGSVSQLDKQRPASIGRRPLVVRMRLLNHPRQRLLMLRPLATRLDTRQTQ